MSYCFNPACPQPVNPNKVTHCQACGSPLLLRNRYVAVKMLGKGGFGRTFLAVDIDMPSRLKVVIKQFLPGKLPPEMLQKSLEMFQREAVLLEKLGKHPQIPTLYAYFTIRNQYYLVMEFIDGKDLLKELEVEGPFNQEKAIDFLRGLLPVIDFLHQHNVIHRDIKPANIIRNSKGELVLVDFGAAKEINRLAEAAAAPGTMIGSMEYVPPEQVVGNAVPASDLYSLGATCVHLITGKKPSLVRDLLTDTWPWRKHLPPGVEIPDFLGNVLDKLLQGAVLDRYKSGSEALKDLEIGLLREQSKSMISLYPSRLDYAQLEYFLSVGDLKAADMETWNLLCRALGRPAGSKLAERDIARIPCNELLNLDILWLRYSNNRFGFSVKCDIYEAEGQNYRSFCEKIGYRVKRAGSMAWINGSRINYSHEAPRGHLPWIPGFYEADTPLGQEGLMRQLLMTVRSCQRKLSPFTAVTR
ncbi:MAG: protein kinase domain-containing protein [Pseudanabaenaceae cyanobacterium]